MPPPPWSIVVGIVAALALIFLLGVGYGQQWGAPQWGPLAAWIAGAATFGAVVVALREAARSQRIVSPRLNDHFYFFPAHLGIGGRLGFPEAWKDVLFDWSDDSPLLPQCVRPRDWPPVLAD